MIDGLRKCLLAGATGVTTTLKVNGRRQGSTRNTPPRRRPATRVLISGHHRPAGQLQQSGRQIRAIDSGLLGFCLYRLNPDLLGQDFAMVSRPIPILDKECVNGVKSAGKMKGE